jgi:hypothetical protein
MLSYMKCGRTECEKPRLLGSAFCKEHQDVRQNEEIILPTDGNKITPKSHGPGSEPMDKLRELVSEMREKSVQCGLAGNEAGRMAHLVDADGLEAALRQQTPALPRVFTDWWAGYEKNLVLINAPTLEVVKDIAKDTWIRAQQVSRKEQSHDAFALETRGPLTGHYVCECGADLGDAAIDEIQEVARKHCKGQQTPVVGELREAVLAEAQLAAVSCMDDIHAKRVKQLLASQPDTPPTPREGQPGMTVAGWGLPVDGAPWEMANTVVQPLRPEGYIEARVVSTRRETEDDEDAVAWFLGPNRDKNAEAIISMVNGRAAGQTSGEALREAQVAIDQRAPRCPKHGEWMLLSFYDRPGSPPGNGWVCRSCAKARAALGQTSTREGEK